MIENRLSKAGGYLLTKIVLVAAGSMYHPVRPKFTNNNEIVYLANYYATWGS